MKVTNPVPSEKIAGYVERILIIEHYKVTSPFTLPLYANGSPTLLFQTAKGQIKGNTNNLTLFGQTVFPETLTIKDNFTLIAYFFKPYALFSLFGVSPQELTDNPINLNLLTSKKTSELQERLLNADSTETMLTLLDNYIFSLITKIKTDIQIVRYATTEIVANPIKQALKTEQWTPNMCAW